MSRITRDQTAETYRVRVNHEWATVVLFGWSVEGQREDRYRECGEILINSSYGQWAYSWSHMGSPFKRFLQRLDRSYMAGKMMGSDAYKFDGELTVRELRTRLLEWRGVGDLNKEEARALWDYILERQDELESNTHDFVGVMHQAAYELFCTQQIQRFIQEPWERLCQSIDIQFKGFWAEIWPAFMAELKREELEQVVA